MDATDGFRAVGAWLQDSPQVVSGFVGGVLVALGSDVTVPRKVLLCLGAPAMAHYGGHWMVTIWPTLSPQLAGFVVGLFGVVILFRVLNALHAVDLGAPLSKLLNGLVDRFLSAIGSAKKGNGEK